MTVATKLSYADTMTQFGLVSCDFLFTAENGVEDFTVYAQDPENDTQTTVTPLFDYNNDEQSEAIKEIILAIVDDAFPQIDNVTEVSGSFYQSEGEITFEGDVSTVITGVCGTIS